MTLANFQMLPPDQKRARERERMREKNLWVLLRAREMRSLRYAWEGAAKDEKISRDLTLTWWWCWWNVERQKARGIRVNTVKLAKRLKHGPGATGDLGAREREKEGMMMRRGT